MPTEDWKKELFEIFFARLGTILIVTLLVTTGAVLIALFWPPTYVATGTVLVRSMGITTNPGSLENPQGRIIMRANREDLANEVKMLESPELIERGLIRMQSPPRNPEDTRADHSGLSRQVRQIRGNLNAEVVPSSQVIQVSLFSKDAEWAERVLGALMEEYIGYRAKKLSGTTQTDFLEAQTKEYAQQLRESEDKLIDLAKGASVAMVAEEIAKNIDLKNALEQEMVTLRNLRINLEQQIKPVRLALQDDGVQYFAFLDSAPINQMAMRLNELTGELGAAQRTYRDDSTKVQSIQGDLQMTYDRMRDEVGKILGRYETELAGVNAQFEATEKQIAQLTERNVELQTNLVEVQRVTRDIDLLSFSYETFFKRAEESEIETAVADKNFSTDVTILSMPEYSASLVFPKKGLTILLGVVIGFIAGCSLGFIAEFLDHTVRRPADITRNLNLPVVASIKQS